MREEEGLHGVEVSMLTMEEDASWYFWHRDWRLPDLEKTKVYLYHIRQQIDGITLNTYTYILYSLPWLIQY